jgi:hypothetical protein
MRQLVLLYRQTLLPVTFKYLLSATSPCIADESIATVNVNNQPDAGTDGNTVCESSVSSIDLFSLITGEDTGGTWSRLTGTGGTLMRQQVLYRQALLPVRLNIYFQQHLHVLQMRASLQLM